MKFIYTIAITLYYLLIKIAALFNKKALQWVNGRKHQLEKMQQSFSNQHSVAWFHAASLGEFEQGRPVIEAFRKHHPNYKIVLTFFSPSGYEIRKNYEGADWVGYLPIDLPHKINDFITTVNPKIVFIIKYEYWFNLLNTLQKRNIPIYLISGIFSPRQFFFKWYGKYFLKIISKITYFFVQNQASKQLLNAKNITNVMVSGDTRFDRVYSISQTYLPNQIVEAFKQNKKILICGSTWEKDESIISRYANNFLPNDLKIIITPHEVNANHLKKITTLFNKPYVKYSEATTNNVINAQILIIDCIGLLSTLYRYGTIAYIGGGFGKGIHNILEPACFGMPILFGPNYKKFSEAHNLIALGSAFVIKNHKTFYTTITQLLSNNKLLQQTSIISKNYIATNTGATEKIINAIKIRS